MATSFVDPQQIQSELEKRHLRLRQLENPYLKTKDFLKTAAWQEKRDAVLLKLSTCLASYRQGQDAVLAVYVIAQAKQILLEVQEITDVIVEYEDIERNLKTYYASRKE